METQVHNVKKGAWTFEKSMLAPSDVRESTMENKKVSHRPIPSYRGRCFTVRFGRDGAAVESGVQCTGEMGKTGFFCIYAKTVLSSGCQGINYYNYVHVSQSSLNKKVKLKEI